ncbi:MAG: hypothetical protein JSR46_06400 [Verrucomicrobia bacterium]|nr:hypothetical protein [Verrucomicrobiota bacterium]
MNLEAFFGLGLGYNFALAIKKELEVKQGKSDYHAALYQMQGLTSLTNLAYRLFSQLPSSPMSIGITVGNTILPFVGLVLYPASAVIKNGHYEEGIHCFDALMEKQCPRLMGALPSKISETSVKVFSFFADNSNILTGGAIVVGAIAAPFIGMGSLVAGIGLPLAFRALEAANLVPEKVSICVEKYMPSVANASLLVGGTLFSQVMAFAALTSGIPGVSAYVQKRIEKIVNKFVSAGPTLEEIDAPWNVCEDLSYNMILYILENDDKDLFKINPAACSKFSHIGAVFPESRDFKLFYEVFNKIDWRDRCHLLKPAFRDDDRFLDLLRERFPGHEPPHYRAHFEEYLEKIMTVSQEDYFAGQLIEQMKIFVAVLCGERPVEGSIQDLEESRDAAAKILGFVQSQPEGSRAVEDILIKLAIEGGEYCARALRRVTDEILSGILADGIPGLKDPMKSYEFKVRKRLEFLRKQIMQGAYLKMCEIMVRLAKEGNGVWVSKVSQTTDEHAVAIAQDVHTSDLFETDFALGFYPLLDHVRNQFGALNLPSWMSYSSVRQGMYTSYYSQLDQSIHEVGEIHFAIYMRQKIGELKLLSGQQKELLIDKMVDYSNGEKTMSGFRRLFFVMQGILTVVKESECNPSMVNTNIEEELTEWEILED